MNFNALQSPCKAVGRSEIRGASSNVVGVICPLIPICQNLEGKGDCPPPVPPVPTALPKKSLAGTTALLLHLHATGHLANVPR